MRLAIPLSLAWVVIHKRAAVGGHIGWVWPKCQSVNAEVAAALHESGGVIAHRRYPHLGRTCRRLVARGELCSPLHGVFARVGAVDEPELRMLIGLAWLGPDAVVCGLSAARLSFWSDCRLRQVDLCLSSRARTSRPGWRVVERRLPDELIWQRAGCRFTSPALTAVDLAAGPFGGEVIDRVLRTRSATLRQLWRALELTPGRRLNRTRAELLHDSRDQPWSEAERELHRMLRASGIAGWTTNAWIGDEAGGYFADVLFGRERLILEVDGFETHGARSAFEADRRRRNALVLAGYVVLNFTWRQLVDEPAWVIECARRALIASGVKPRPGRRSGR